MPTIDPSKQENSLPTELRTVVTRLMKKLRSKSPTRDTLSLTERSVIRLLDEHKELLPSEIARIEKVTTQSMSQILNHLSDLGYITRTPSETDKRKITITLSEGGLALLNASRNERDEWLSHALHATCTSEELEILRQALAPLKKLLEYE
ncbi:MarR family transcriptional regulator [Cytophagaceae bacterium YF14B1]|uniref:MarR family transcriptional regulator n=1 Tax=Xanthocytophaga flava TaxID=3048013 RepID=A0AAE3U7P9_9BACT|nr:MarR family transcriptional regulator [Xanthocytophaga flavus]MDJ1481847.1 MarR family transcriptional regulator [Xanthocytophaga flavus]